MPPSPKPKDKLDVFVYRDSEDRLVATTETPLAMVGEFAYHDNLATPLLTGQKLKAYVRAVRPDGKIDLRLDPSGYKRVAPLTDLIVQALESNAGHLAFDDDSSPEAIRHAFGVSKKAFKQALGKLYKRRRISFLHPGIKLVENSAWSPGDSERTS